MTVWALGSNGSGQLGIGNKNDTDECTAVKLPDEYKDADIKKIVAGGNHTLFLLSPSGIVLATGETEDGQCGDVQGVPAELHSPQPTSIVLEDGTRLTEFDNVSATWSASFFVAPDRLRIFVRGTGLSGELGLGEGVTQAGPSSVITMPSTIKTIVSCLAHTVVLLVTGEVYGWGKGRKGQLSTSADSTSYTNIWTPTKIEVDFVVSQVLCGADFTCFLAIPPEGTVKLIGADAKDRHGLRRDCPDWLPQWKRATATWGSVAISATQGIVSWGRNERGQRVPSTLRYPKRLAAGSEHWLAITAEGEVLVGGWGEHGNCGRIEDGGEVVAGDGQVLTINGKIGGETARQIFAGCATSFIVTWR